MNEYTGPNDIDTREKLTWMIYVDGFSTLGESEAGLVLWGPYGAKISYALKFGFGASNNEAEYEGQEAPNFF